MGLACISLFQGSSVVPGEPGPPFPTRDRGVAAGLSHCPPTHPPQRSGSLTEVLCSAGGGGGSSLTQSCPTLVTPWTGVLQAPLSIGFPRHEYWSRLPFPSPGGLRDPTIKPPSPALQSDSLLTEPPGRPSPGCPILCTPCPQGLIPSSFQVGGPPYLSPLSLLSFPFAFLYLL